GSGLRSHPRAHPPDRSQGAAQAASSFALEAPQVFRRELVQDSPHAAPLAAHPPDRSDGWVSKQLTQIFRREAHTSHPAAHLEFCIVTIAGSYNEVWTASSSH